MNPKQRLTLSADVLRSFYAARGRRVTLDDLSDVLGADAVPTSDGVRPRTVRREDIREIVRRLDEEGFVDAGRMRLTLQGFALATSLTERRLVRAGVRRLVA